MTSRHARGRRVLLDAAGGAQDSQAIAAAADLVCVTLRDELSVLIGAGGVRALLGRALRLAQRESPLLKDVVVAPDGSLSGLAQTLGSATAPEAEAAGAAVIDHVLDLLASLMGEDVGLRPVRRLWPGIDLDVGLGEENR